MKLLDRISCVLFSVALTRVYIYFNGLGGNGEVVLYVSYLLITVAFLISFGIGYLSQKN